jgi:hypothetical protein
MFRDMTAMYDPRSADPRTALAGVRVMEEECDWLLVRAVRLARAAGYDWGHIGRLLGRSRQAVRKRFERLAPLVGPLPPELVRRGIAAREFNSLYESLADARRRARYDADDDPVAW